MKVILFIFSLGAVLMAHPLSAQVQSNNIIEPNIAGGQNPFFDASAKFDIAGDATSNGKGFVFPRTDLTTWVFAVDMLNGVTYPGAFDGMIVYNIGEGSTLTNSGLSDNPDMSIEVSPGYYYFSNPGSRVLGANTSITNGKWVRLNDSNISTLPSGSANPATTSATIGDVFFNTTTGSLYVFNGTLWADTGSGGVADGSITESKLQAEGGGALASGQDGQVLTSVGDGTFKWTDVTVSDVSGNLYQGTVASITDFNNLTWTTVAGSTNLGTSIPVTAKICELSQSGYTWIAFPRAWGMQSFFYKYDGAVYAVFDGIEKKIISASETSTVDYQVWLFKTTPDITVELIANNY